MTPVARRASIACLLAASLCAASTWAQVPEKKTVSIAVGGKAALYYLPLTLAERLGYFKEAGLDVQILDFAGGAKSLQAMMGGSSTSGDRKGKKIAVVYAVGPIMSGKIQEAPKNMHAWNWGQYQ